MSSYRGRGCARAGRPRAAGANEARVGAEEPAQAAMGGGHIFSGHIDVGCAAPMMVGMLAFAMSFEFLTNVMEEKVRRPPLFSSRCERE